MKFKIVFYLFVFVCIVLFYQLINTNKILNHQDRLIQNQNSMQLRLRDSLSNLKQTLSVLNYFTTTTNEQSEAEETTVKSKLLEYNTKGNLHQLINALPKEERFLIDKIQLVNQQWILIGFRSDRHWGQAFITYKKTNLGYDFDALRHLISPL
jgi:hypothetical protein